MRVPPETVSLSAMYVGHRSSTIAPRRVSSFIVRMMILCKHSLQRFIARGSGLDEDRSTAGATPANAVQHESVQQGGAGSDPGESRVLHAADPATRAGLLRLSEARASQ